MSRKKIRSCRLFPIPYSLFPLLALLALAGCGSGDGKGDPVRFTVPRGSGMSSVADTLAKLENLKADQLKFTQEVLYRQGSSCGVYFCLYGPRELQLSAIWEIEGNSVLFYGSCGRRVQRTVLRTAPTIAA